MKIFQLDGIIIPVMFWALATALMNGANVQPTISLPVSDSAAKSRWGATSLILSATPEEHIISGSFSFSNISDKPLKIIGVRSSCGCTGADFQPLIVYPGKGGVVILHIALKGRRDPFDVSALVSFGGEVEPQMLKCRVIPYGYINVEPRILVWKENELQQGKTVTVDLVHAGDSGLENASALSDADFSVKSEYQPQKNRWELTVTPKNKARTEDMLMLSFKDSNHRTRQMFLAFKIE